MRSQIHVCGGGGGGGGDVQQRRVVVSCQHSVPHARGFICTGTCTFRFTVRVSHSTVYMGHYSVLKEIFMITFCLWCTGLLTNSMLRCAQEVPLVKKLGKLYAQERC